MLGCYNAGTTLVKKAVIAHPAVCAPPVEGDVLTSELSCFEGGGWHRCMYGNRADIENYRKTRVINARKITADWSPWIESDKVFVDKSIAHSCRMGQLRIAFPGCKFVAITRDKNAVADGIRKRSQPTGKARKLLGRNSYPIDLLMRQYSYIYSRILEDWDDRDSILVSYEQFLADPVATTDEVVAQLGLEATSVQLDGDLLKVAHERIAVRRPRISLAKPITNVDQLARIVNEVDIN